MRIGIGYDVHPFDETRPLMLGGVRIDGSPGLKGYSDADVLLHAIIDALLGAAALGDIGKHFPSDDPVNEDIDSRTLLRRTRELLWQAGFEAVNIDATVIAERPRLEPHIAPMRREIARIMQMDELFVSVKATTQDGLGAIGRGEGIGAMAVALIK